MNRILQRLVTFAALTLLVLLGVFPSFAQSNARVRFVHLTPSVGAVDVYVAGSLLVQDLDYGTASLFLSVPAGDHEISVTLANDTTPVFSQTITADSERPASFVLADGAQFFAVSENLNETPAGGSRLLLVHALDGGPAVDIKLAEPVQLGGAEQPTGTPLATSMAYSTTFGAFDVPAQVYTVNVLAAGSEDALLSEVTLPLAAGTSYTAFVYGTADAPEALLLAAATQPTANDGLVRFVHAVADGPAVDIYDGDTLIVPALGANTATEHIALAAGDHTLVVRGVGDEAIAVNVLSQADISVEAGTAQTVVALEAGGAVVVANYIDDVSNAADNSTAVVSVINTVTQSTLDTLTIDGQTIAEGISFAENSDSASVAPTAGTLSFDLSVDNETASANRDNVVLYGGTYYNVIVVPGSAAGEPQALIFPTSISAGIGSAPDSSDTLTVVAVATPEVVVTEAPAVATTAPVVATAAPVTTAPNAITGRVLLDPGANLQLRQNPSADALSLGLAPAGSTLVVKGREGRPVALVDGQQPPAEADSYEDPVGLLVDEDADLDPNATWINVTFNTPDGGRITSWVLAQFLDIRNDRNEKVRLRDLEPVGRNIPGTAVETAVTPPPNPTDVLQAVVFNLDRDVSLNIRRTPSTDGEVIGRVTNGTTMVFLGGVEDEDWAYVQFTTPEGGVIEGWVSTLYIQYQYNGRTYSLEDFQNLVSRTTSQALYELVLPDTIGGVRGNVAPLTVPTVDPLRDQFVAQVQLDSGSNLQLRRLPDPTSESLNLVPSGTQLIVISRTEDAAWLKVTFEGETGWISSDFVSILFNGASVSISDIPVEVLQSAG